MQLAIYQFGAGDAVQDGFAEPITVKPTGGAKYCIDVFSAQLGGSGALNYFPSYNLAAYVVKGFVHGHRDRHRGGERAGEDHHARRREVRSAVALVMPTARARTAPELIGHSRPMTGQQFLDSAAERLRAAGYEVSGVQLPGGHALVGYRSRFRLAWMATKLHLFTVVATVPRVDAASLERFANDSLDHAAATKGALRGFQSGVATIAVLAGDSVAPDAVQFAHDKLVRRFSAFTWPGAVDLTTGATYSHEGRVLVGGIYSGWMREQTAVALGTR